MQIEPSAEKFAARYEAGAPQVVWTTLVADLETPVSAFLKIAGSRPMSFLLESVEGGAVRGRYSIIGLEPDLIFRADGDRAEINRTPVEDISIRRRGSGGVVVFKLDEGERVVSVARLAEAENGDEGGK